MAFPLDSGAAAPSYYATNTGATNAARGYHFFVGDTVILKLSQATPTTYTVYDYDGNQVATGSVSSTTVNLGSSWDPGWYRVWYTGTSTDTVYGTSYGANCFTVMRSNSNLPLPPTSTAGNGAPGQHSNPPDYTTRGMLGIPACRMEMAHAVNTDATGNDSVAVIAADAPFATTWWSQISTDSCVDPDRPRYLWTALSSRTWDKIDIQSTGSGAWCSVYPKDGTIAANGNNLYVSAGPGTSSGSKLVVYYPNSSTVVETWDNLATADAAAVTINAGSSYVWLQTITSGSQATTLAVTQIGQAFHDGCALASSTLYPLGVTYYEGPINEPGMNDAGLTQKLKLFKAGIQAGNADARIIGPTPVDIVNNWQAFFQDGGHQYLDVLAFHDYNTFLGADIGLARYQIENMLALKNQYAPTLPLWQTEALSCAVCIGGGASSTGLFVPRLSGNTILKLIMWEQYGLPRERNSYWYDFSHGFWGVANFQWCSDGAPLPVTILQRVLAEEVFGKPFSYRFNMGSEAAEKIATGSLYKAHPGSLSPSVAVFCAGSHIPGMTLTLDIAGTTSNIVTANAFGKNTTLTQSSGKITIPLDDTPTYVELPAGVTCSVHSLFDGAQDWGTAPNPSVSRAATTHTLGGTTFNSLADDQFTTHYGAGTTSTGLAFSPNLVPDTAVLLFPSTIAVDRVIVFNGPVEQSVSALLTFTVDTTTDGGTTWTTQESVDVSAGAVSTRFGTTSANAGCGYETFWPQQRIFPVSFASPVSCNGVRISVSATSYGGSPDAQSWQTSAAAVDEQRVSIEEIMVISASTPTNSVTAPANLVLPAISGGTGLGTVAACSTGSWSNIPTKYTYQWQRDATNITGATKPEYLFTTSDVGHDVSCIVTASNLGGSASANSGAYRVPSFAPAV